MEDGGSGIFVSPTGLLERTGSVGLSLIIWAACGLLSMLGAMAYAELGTLIPYSGAEYTYYLAAFGGFPAFIYCWVSVFILKPSMLAIICLSFAEYVINGFVPLCNSEDTMVKIVGAFAIGALSYAELGIVIPYSGGEIAYYVHSFGPLHHFFGPLLGFLFGWTSVLLLKPSSLAILTLTFAKYVVLPFWELRKEDGSCDGNSEELSEKLVAALCIGVITFVNCFDVKLATRVQNVFTTAKLLAVVIIVITGIVKFAQGESKLNLGFNGTTKEYGKIATAFYSGLWAYDGWYEPSNYTYKFRMQQSISNTINVTDMRCVMQIVLFSRNNLNYVTEELKNPYVNLPRAIMIAIPLVTVCYLLVNISYLIVLDQATLLASDAVAVVHTTDLKCECEKEFGFEVRTIRPD
ncbi:unnamed protein product [Darwinula stevensoni]|uniref:B(0,+)-type amino acid transporter 1 n=1 Tax=Darwinula stevensoni TaxID=69355 RepID=A0A7R9A828_9CRUS|nr:unnamed protein product [Darwinula stevensoni]CAG0894785.1 unnamed protein product [Darwinula stevensoni]